ncbi:MAG: nucleotidyltransferase domain-containing protein [Micrococcales bacterium]|nr:nucleotidyltransferase domain-containing protein [Micrococcales bacterium]
MPASLAQVARRADEAVAKARQELVTAVRRAAAKGMTQSQIATQIGRSQPEVSRLLHFHGTSRLARRLRRNTEPIRRLLAENDGSNPRVFGSVATGQDNDDSDIDLLFTMGTPLSLMQLEVLQYQISQIVGAPVDLHPDSALRPEIRGRILNEAVAL